MENFIEQLVEENLKFEKDSENGLSDINIFEALDLEEKENYHSKFIAYLIDTNKGHYQKIFAEKFLKKLEKSIKNANFKDLNTEDIKSVEIEFCIKDNRRIDILISLSNQRYIIIENKIYAKDQENQLKDYISYITEKAKSNDNIITIYLHQDENASPSKSSLGDFKIEENFVKNKKGESVSHYFKMDYKWIKEWICECVKAYESKLNENSNFNSSIKNIIFTLNQYKNILEWYITNEYNERNDVLDYILQDDKSGLNLTKAQKLKNAMILHRYSKNKTEFKNINEENYKKAKEIVRKNWDNICKHIMKEFFDNFEKETKIEKDMILLGNRTDESLVNCGIFAFYPKAYESKNLYPCIYLYFLKSKYDTFGLTFEIGSDDENNESEKYEKCLKLFKNINEENVRKYEGHYYCDKLINDKKLEGEYAFIYWLIENYDNYKDEFVKILNKFLNKEPIKQTYAKINEILKI